MGKTPSRDELNGLEYIVGALKESLRLYSVVPVVTRKCLGDDYLGGEFVPKGTTVIIFVQGARNCLCQYLALLEARVVMANLLRKFKFTSSRETNGAKHTKMIPIAPADGIWFTVD